MQRDHSWDALLRPGEAAAYFTIDTVPRMLHDPDEATINAWWLAELSRLAYRPDRLTPTRQQILERVGAREEACLQSGTIRALLVSVDAPLGPISALICRGTSDVRDWRDNLNALPVKWAGGGAVHRGFAEAMERLWSELIPHLERMHGFRLYAGHSLGAAVATLVASRHPPDGLHTFGSPRVGDSSFAATLDQVAVHRFVNGRDLVTEVPPALGSRPFVHVGRRFGLADGLEPVPDGRRIQSLLKADRRWYDPHPALADHAPINYVARLQERV